MTVISVDLLEPLESTTRSGESLGEEREHRVSIIPSDDTIPREFILHERKEEKREFFRKGPLKDKPEVIKGHNCTVSTFLHSLLVHMTVQPFCRFIFPGEPS